MITNIIKNRIEWERTGVDIGQKVQIKDTVGILIGYKEPHSPIYHFHNYLNPILIALDERGLPTKKVTFYDDFNMQEESKLNLEDCLIVGLWELNKDKLEKL